MKIVGLGIYARLKANSTATAKCKYFFGDFVYSSGT